MPDAASLACSIIFAYGLFLAYSNAAFSASYSALAAAALSSASSSATSLSCSFSASANYYYFLKLAACFSFSKDSPAVLISIIFPKIPLAEILCSF